MMENSAKKYLQQIFAVNKRIERLMLYREQLRKDMYSLKSPSTDGDRVQTSMQGDAMVRMIAKVDAIERDIVAELERLYTLRDKLIKDIDKISDLEGIEPETKEAYKTLLFERHVLLWHWDQIALSMNYSERQIYRMKYKAWDAFERVIECQS